MNDILKKHLVLTTFLMVSFYSLFSQQRNSFFGSDTIQKITPVSINTSLNEFSPMVLGDTLFFISSELNQDKKNRNEYFQLFKSPIENQGNLSKRIKVSDFTSPYHIGPISWCEKTGELFITENYENTIVRRNALKEKVIRLKIIIAKRIKGKWMVTDEFPYYSPEYSVGHPAVSLTGDTLVFSSDMPGGYGEADLYLSIRKNGKWGVPVNLGPDINTPEKELFPGLLRMDNRGSFLVFSSNGRSGGKGGLDLFYTAFPSHHTSIYEFEFPFNSVHDDFSMVISEKKGYGYFSSNRGSSENDDIYYFTFNNKENTERGLNKKSREIVIISNQSHHPVPDATVLCSDRKVFYGDSLGRATLPWDYTKNLSYSVQAFGYEPISNISLEKDTIALSILYNHPLIVKNIWYELDKSEVLPENAKELDRVAGFLKTNPDCRAHLKVYTDEKGSDQYNLNLSQSRASAAAVYISSIIRDSSRIVGEGSGNKFPIYKPLPGKPLSIQQHRQNRRIEVVFTPIKKPENAYSAPVVQTVKEKSEIKEELFLSRIQYPYYLILGSFSDQQQALNYLKKTRSEGLKSTAFLLNKNYRVGIGYNSMEIAKKSLEYFKNKYINCWILQLKR
jgi:hypothetical protein